MLSRELLVSVCNGCPNWQEDISRKPPIDVVECDSGLRESGIIVVAHVGCGTWRKQLPNRVSHGTLPLSAIFSATPNADNLGDKQILLVPKCCGRKGIHLCSSPKRTIIKEAGGKVTDWKGSQLDLAADQAEWRVIFSSGGVLVTNGFLHDPILEMIAFTSSVS
ncbi:hypothetical protein RJ641_018201 [Dillenia turbinata]|uniref:Uncharacterized protein n=1 Tax=Dillenia turbinata TaxID=194707 RepID=A0AAN8UL25_9MAGN